MTDEHTQREAASAIGRSFARRAVLSDEGSGNLDTDTLTLLAQQRAPVVRPLAELAVRALLNSGFDIVRRK